MRDANKLGIEVLALEMTPEDLKKVDRWHELVDREEFSSSTFNPILINDPQSKLITYTGSDHSRKWKGAGMIGRLPSEGISAVSVCLWDSGKPTVPSYMVRDDSQVFDWIIYAGAQNPLK